MIPFSIFDLPMWSDDYNGPTATVSFDVAGRSVASKGVYDAQPNTRAHVEYSSQNVSTKGESREKAATTVLDTNSSGGVIPGAKVQTGGQAKEVLQFGQFDQTDLMQGVYALSFTTKGNYGLQPARASDGTVQANTFQTGGLFSEFGGGQIEAAAGQHVATAGLSLLLLYFGSAEGANHVSVTTRGTFAENPVGLGEGVSGIGQATTGQYTVYVGGQILIDANSSPEGRAVTAKSATAGLYRATDTDRQSEDSAGYQLTTAGSYSGAIGRITQDGVTRLTQEGDGRIAQYK